MSAAPDEPEEATQLSERTRPRAVRARRTGDPATEPLPEDAVGPVEDTIDGSTLVARRESRRREERRVAGADTTDEAIAAPVPPPAPTVPVAARESYRARPAEPVIAPRRAAPVRPAQAVPDGARAEADRRRAARRTALIVAVSASALTVLCAASLLVITLAPW